MVSRRFLLVSPMLSLPGCRGSREKIIAVVPKATSHLFFVAIHAGVERAARDSHVKVLWNGPNEETDHGRQIQIVENMIARRVDALAISATDERALAGVVERTVNAGIPVTIFDSGVNIENYVSFIATDNYGAGCTAARQLCRRLPASRRKIGMVMHKPGGTSTTLREKGFEETVAKEFPDIEIAARQFGMSDPARSRSAAENILTAHPDLAGVFASSEPSSLGAIQAIRAAGYSGKLRLVTFDTSETHVEALREGTIDAMLVQDAYRIGYEAVHSLTEVLEGRKPPRRLNLPARVIVKADMDRADVRALLMPTAGAQVSQ